jgi:hypothetical protein
MSFSVELKSILQKVNIPSMDDGRIFTDASRKNAIQEILQKSTYHCIKSDGIGIIYQHARFQHARNYVLISCHIDSLYSTHFARSYKTELMGTLDNSISVALLVMAMEQDLIDPQCLICFTGDEEGSSSGAMQALAFLLKDPHLRDFLLMAMVLDVTAEAYTTHAFTFENVYEPQHPGLLSDAINRIFPDSNPYFLTSDESDVDESDIFIDHGIQVFSFCIPVRPRSALKDESMDVWMHHESGIFVRQASLRKFQSALVKVTAGLLETGRKAKNVDETGS